MPGTKRKNNIQCTYLLQWMMSVGLVLGWVVFFKSSIARKKKLKIHCSE